MVDVRLMLDFEPRREAATMEMNLVASHMRLAYSIRKDRAFLRSGYSSEPILAEAAAQQMYAFRQHKPSVMLDILNDNIKTGLLDRGERGELVARAIITAAYDHAVERDHPPLNPETPPFYSQGCSAITFIEELFSDAYAQEILDSRPDNVKGVTLREAFKTARIRFTHFVKMADDTGTTTAGMFAAFIRGMAIISHTGQTMVDAMIPIVLWDNHLCEAVMTSFMLQFKRRIKAGTIAAYTIEQKTLRFFPEMPEAEPRPYITLIMELGLRDAISPLADTRVEVLRRGGKPAKRPNPKSSTPGKIRIAPSMIVIPQKGEPSCLTRSMTRSTGSNLVHPRYSIFAYGSSAMVYKAIDPDQKAAYDFLLASGHFLGEHPRQDLQSLGAVRKMKPFWVAGQGCYHWLTDDLLNNGEEVDDLAWLVTGSMLDNEAEMDVVDEAED